MRIHSGRFLDSNETYVRIEAPAKLNLFLEVIGKRRDGYHEIETLMCPISLCDHLLIEPIPGDSVQFDLELPDVGSSGTPTDEDPGWQIPADDSNLVMRGVEMLRDSLNIQDGIRIRLDKQIPAAAGLAGGSSDCAAALVGCSYLWKRWNRRLVTEICQELGSDIAFFLGDSSRIGLGFATGRGEHCEMLRCAPELHFLVSHPPAGCSTKAIYQSHELRETPREAAKMLRACQDGQANEIGAELYNALQLSALRHTPWIEHQFRLLSECGGKYCLMSGSGSSCFALFEHGVDAEYRSKVFQDFTRKAEQEGISRVYQVDAWYSTSIEDQLDLE